MTLKGGRWPQLHRHTSTLLQLAQGVAVQSGFQHQQPTCDACAAPVLARRVSDQQWGRRTVTLRIPAPGVAGDQAAPNGSALAARCTRSRQLRIECRRTHVMHTRT